MKRKTGICALVLGLVLFLATAMGSVAAMRPVPENHDLVFDQPAVLMPSEKAMLHDINTQLLPSGAQIGVCIEQSLEGENLEERANAVFRNWKLGDAQKNNGLLLYVALRDRKMRIEVGYGLESILTDSYCGDVIRDVMAPAFKRGAYGEGILAAAQRMVLKFEKEYNLQVKMDLLPGAVEPSFLERFLDWLANLLKLLAFVLPFFLLARWARKRGGGGGGGSGGSSGSSSGSSYSSSGSSSGYSGGGGSSGGGGASGSW